MRHWAIWAFQSESAVLPLLWDACGSFQGMVQGVLYPLVSLISPGAKLTIMETQLSVTPQFISGNGFNYQAPWSPSHGLHLAHEIKLHSCKPSRNPSVIERCRHFFSTRQYPEKQLLSRYRPSERFSHYRMICSSLSWFSLSKHVRMTNNLTNICTNW